MKLTKNNYFTNKNRYISNSKINDWQKSKNFFYRKHILGEIEARSTDALTIGKAVDVWLTGSRKRFEKEFIAVKRRGGDVPKGVTELTEGQNTEIIALCEAVERTSVYKQIKKDKGFKAQQILQSDIKLGLFDGICGIPDWYKIEENKCTIVDLKTARDVSENKYYYHCLEYGYFRQIALYQMLIELNNPEIKFEHKAYHIAVEKDPDGINKVVFMELSQAEIEDQKIEISKILSEIKKEKEFAIPDVTWDDVIIIGGNGW